MLTLEESLKKKARELGFGLVGIAPATAADGFDRLTEWLRRGYAGDMRYMDRHREARCHPSSILSDVRSVVMVGMEYGETGTAVEAHTDLSSAVAQAPNPGKPAKIARYAAGSDYHDTMRAGLNELLSWTRDTVPNCVGRGIVDTAPLLERDFARRAGLGWIGKNTMLINKLGGSYFFLGALLLNVELKTDAPHAASHCGTCTACLDACPTQAFTGPGWLDARKCISYQTIELRGPIPVADRSGVGDWLFGCDVCQEVCPWNRHDRSQPESVDPAELLTLSEAEFRARYRGTAFLRAKRRGLLRNAAIVLGNTGDERALPALEAACQDAEPLVREAAEWALAEIRGRQSLHGEVDFGLPVGGGSLHESK